MVNDGDANSAGVTSTVTVAGVNDAPTVAGAGGTLAYTEGDGAQVIDGALTITDVDDTNIASATVTLSAGFVSAEDVLAFTNTAAITGVYNAVTGVLTLTGSDTLANYEARACEPSLTRDTNVGQSEHTGHIAPLASPSMTETIRVTPSRVTINHHRGSGERRVRRWPRLKARTLAYTRKRRLPQPSTAAHYRRPTSTTRQHRIRHDRRSRGTTPASAEDVLAFVDTAFITGVYNAVDPER